MWQPLIQSYPSPLDAKINARLAIAEGEIVRTVVSYAAVTDHRPPEAQVAGSTVMP
jgi:hypothetical protein